MKLFIGCSGWNYKDWKGNFYPDTVTKKDWLAHYMKVFNTVEVNNTFYRLPKEKTIKSWKKSAYGKDFLFTFKGSRYVTQMKKLNNVGPSIKKFEDVAKPMKTKLGCILWQLPPNLHRNDKKLSDFCKNLKRGNKNVIEFRHESWFDEEVYKILRKNNISCCSISAPDFPEELLLTTKIAYLRLHGKGKNWYDYNYSRAELNFWYQKVKNCGAKEAYIYFNNDINARAPENAKQLKAMFE